MPLTLEKIAREAGVSRSTVSRVFNQHTNVSAEARQRVLAVADRYDFHPNMVARSLASGRTRVIGLVIPETVGFLFTDPFFPLLIQGISSACNAYDYSVMLWLSEPELERKLIGKIVHSGMLDGVLVASMHTHDPLIPSLLKRALPFILVGRYPADERVSFVDVDNSDAAREATAYLFRLGYRRVATIAGPQQMIAGHDRLQGYLEALHARGVAPDPDLIAESDFTEQGGYAAMQQLLFRGRRAGLERSPDAVFVASDTMALGALRALHEAGKRVPDDVALIGFDDMPFAAHTDPPLTTVRQPIPRAGSVAAETLFDIIEHPAAPPRRILLNTELVIRASTGDGV